MLRCAIMRSVWLRSATPSTGAGVVVQVPTQCMASCSGTGVPPKLSRWPCRPVGVFVGRTKAQESGADQHEDDGPPSPRIMGGDQDGCAGRAEGAGRWSRSGTRAKETHCYGLCARYQERDGD